MTPGNIAGMAKLAGYDVIALSDHNSAKNCPAFLAACRNNGIIGIPAMELSTREEVHVLCVFPDLESALRFDDYVYARLPDIPNKSGFFGEQLIINEADEITGTEDKLLITASDIGIYEVRVLLKELGGIAIPAHVDRSSFSLLTNLGFYDRSLGFDILEFSKDADVEEIIKANPDMTELGVMINSDAHSLTDMPDAKRVIEARDTEISSILQGIKHLHVS